MILQTRGSRYIIIGSVVCCLLLMNEQLLPSITQLPFLIYVGITSSSRIRIADLCGQLSEKLHWPVQTTDNQQLVDHGPYAV